MTLNDQLRHIYLREDVMRVLQCVIILVAFNRELLNEAAVFEKS